MLGIVVYLHYQLAVKCMALIHQVPAMVGQIMGVADQDRGESQAHSSVYGGIVNFSGSARQIASVVGLKPKPSPPKPTTQGVTPPEGGEAQGGGSDENS